MAAVYTFALYDQTGNRLEVRSMTGDEAARLNKALAASGATKEWRELHRRSGIPGRTPFDNIRATSPWAGFAEAPLGPRASDSRDALRKFAEDRAMAEPRHDLADAIQEATKVARRSSYPSYVVRDADGTFDIVDTARPSRGTVVAKVTPEGRVEKYGDQPSPPQLASPAKPMAESKWVYSVNKGWLEVTVGKRHPNGMVDVTDKQGNTWGVYPDTLQDSKPSRSPQLPYHGRVNT